MFFGFVLVSFAFGQLETREIRNWKLEPIIEFWKDSIDGKLVSGFPLYDCAKTDVCFARVQFYEEVNGKGIFTHAAYRLWLDGSGKLPEKLFDEEAQGYSLVGFQDIAANGDILLWLSAPEYGYWLFPASKDEQPKLVLKPGQRVPGLPETVRYLDYALFGEDGSVFFNTLNQEYELSVGPFSMSILRYKDGQFTILGHFPEGGLGFILSDNGVADHFLFGAVGKIEGVDPNDPPVAPGLGFMNIESGTITQLTQKGTTFDEFFPSLNLLARNASSGNRFVTIAYRSTDGNPPECYLDNCNTEFDLISMETSGIVSRLYLPEGKQPAGNWPRVSMDSWGNIGYSSMEINPIFPFPNPTYQQFLTHNIWLIPTGETQPELVIGYNDNDSTFSTLSRPILSDTSLYFNYGVESYSAFMRATRLNPFIYEGGVVNGATFGPKISPGDWASIFGSNLTAGTAWPWDVDRFPTSWQDEEEKTVRVYVCGKEAPLGYLSKGQINFIVPTDTPTGTPVPVQVVRGEWVGNPQYITLLPTAPALFRCGEFPCVTDAFTGALVTTENPAAQGQIVSGWLQGLGPTEADPACSGCPFGSNPLPWLRDNVQLTVNDQPTTLQYAGGAPGLTIFQINFWMPAEPSLPGDTGGEPGSPKTWEARLTAGGEVISFQIPVK